MIRRPPRSTQSRSSAASDVYKRQGINAEYMGIIGLLLFRLKMRRAIILLTVLYPLLGIGVKKHVVKYKGDEKSYEMCFQAIFTFTSALEKYSNRFLPQNRQGYVNLIEESEALTQTIGEIIRSCEYNLINLIGNSDYPSHISKCWNELGFIHYNAMFMRYYLTQANSKENVLKRMKNFVIGLEKAILLCVDATTSFTSRLDKNCQDKKTKVEREKINFNKRLFVEDMTPIANTFPKEVKGFIESCLTLQWKFSIDNLEGVERKSNKIVKKTKNLQTFGKMQVLTKQGMAQVPYQTGLAIKMKKLTAYCDLRLTTIRNYILFLFDLGKSQDNRLVKDITTRLTRTTVSHERLEKVFDEKKKSNDINARDTFIRSDLLDFKHFCLDELEGRSMIVFKPLQEECTPKLVFLLKQERGKLVDKQFLQNHGEPMIVACSCLLYTSPSPRDS
eukprot:TRINITY_DN5619_c0_g1_i8.p1 TRINITY_DN5619_c0_g1~~TRINITY_DN5619_c0_g1_i8.p1  ORF type:complete len:447 (-),score=69.19 TRINITY_DN5619_c0_g1_i8:56-1396(-)